MSGQPEKICVIGIWHLGGVVSACMADLGFQVVGVAEDAASADALNRGAPPLFEPGLAELMSTNLQAGRLSFTDDLAMALAGASFAWVAFDTPVDDNDEADLSLIFDTARKMAPHLENGTVVLISSQVPVGTCELIEGMIQEANPSVEISIAYSPENLRLGHAIKRFREPQMIVIGSDDPAALDAVENLFRGIDTTKLRMDLRSAEMTKHAINAFLATSISFANELANLCDEAGGNALQVAKALRMDERIGPQARVSPGLGFSGGTLARDLRALQALGNRYGYEPKLINAVLDVNRRQNGLVTKKLEEYFGSLDGRTVAILGLTYTPNTSTLRRSASIEIIADLVAKGATVRAHDPMADRQEVANHTEFRFFDQAREAARGAEALVVITAWPEFRDLDFGSIRSGMKKPLILDTGNMLSKEELIELGFIYIGVGQGKATTKSRGTD